MTKYRKLLDAAIFSFLKRLWNSSSRVQQDLVDECSFSTASQKLLSPIYKHQQIAGAILRLNPPVQLFLQSIMRPNQHLYRAKWGTPSSVSLKNFIFSKSSRNKCFISISWTSSSFASYRLFHTVKEKAPNTEKDILPKSALYPYAPDHVLVVKMEIKLHRIEMDVTLWYWTLEMQLYLKKGRVEVSPHWSHMPSHFSH